MNVKEKILCLLLVGCCMVIGCAETSEQIGNGQSSEQNLQFDPEQPWTGTWNVSTKTAAMFTNNFVLKLKQEGNIVTSVKGSDFSFNGQVEDTRLQGLFFDDEVNMRHDIDVVISNDLKSFEGKDVRQRVITVPIAGVRQD